jgi:hypothetical protein
VSEPAARLVFAGAVPARFEEPAMAQAAFPFDAVAPLDPALTTRPPVAARCAAPAPADRTAFEIGWDYARHRLTPPVAHLHTDSPVLHGWHAGRSAFAGRALRAGVAVQRWLALRLAAWMEGCVFEDVQLTPHLLQQIDTAVCPVTREPLAPADASVQRLCRDAGFAAGNVALVGSRAARAWAAHDCAASLSQAQRLVDDGLDEADGLDAAAWTRLAVLQSFATKLPHAVALTLPLRVLPPNRVRVLNPVQALQVALTLLFAQPGYARRVATIAAWLPDADVRQAYQVFMHTMLARRLAAGATADAAQVRRALEDSWADPLIQRRWQRLASRLTPADCEKLLKRAADRRLLGTGLQHLSAEGAVDGWGLASRGRVQSAEVGSDDTDSGAGARTPGIERSSGSQKVASCVAETACGAFQ